MDPPATTTVRFPTWTHEKACSSMIWTDPIDVSLTIGPLKNESINESDVVIFTVFASPLSTESNSNDKSTPDSEENPIELSGIVKIVDETSLQGGLSSWIGENSKSFKKGATAGAVTPTLRSLVNGTVKRHIVMGLGPLKTNDDAVSEDWTIGYGLTLGKSLAASVTSEKKAATVSFVLPDIIGSNESIMKDLVTSFYENLYVDNRFRTGSNIVKPTEDVHVVQILVEGSMEVAVVDSSVLEIGKSIANGVFLCKDIVNAPHNVLNAESLAQTAVRIADESNGKIKCTIMDAKQCEEEFGMGSFLGVARGAETEPQFIHLVYTPPSATVTKRLGLVGKGILFDTGGYNIKVGMMELMKFDCGGAAAVFGAARALSLLNVPADFSIECHFIVAACENMINQKAYVPSDILIASNGKTIEVMNTDAEGRLTLADALVYADKTVNCDAIMELSTLTGSCMVSLGKGISGVWTCNDELAKEVESISKITGDKSWRMPMAMEYKEELKSVFADIKSIGGRWGSAIHAALFLQEFVTTSKPFVHIDIAGPVWNDKTGATGYGVKLILQWILNNNTTITK